MSKLRKAGETASVSRQPAGMKPSQRAQEVQYRLLLSGAKAEEVFRHSRRFAAAARVGLNGSDEVGGAAIVQQEDALSQTPQGSGAELVAAGAALRNVIGKAGTHVVDFDV